MFEGIAKMKKYGFKGFIPISDLIEDCSQIPTEKGVYMIIKPENERVVFIEEGTGGYFKGRNPNVSVDVLEQEWIEPVKVIYIGKAGGHGKSATLQSRLKQYLHFGQGKSVGHWGGRYIWQINNIMNYLICWKPLLIEEPREIEKVLLKKFFLQYGRLPFANISN